MNRLKHIMTSWGIACLFLLMLIPTTVLAAPDSSSIETFTDSATYINPLYRDVFTEDDLISVKKDKINVGGANLQSDDICSSIEEAAEVVREQFKARTNLIRVEFKTLDSDYYGSLLQIFENAMIHTGDPKEGDYLAYQYGGWTAQIDGYIYNDWYYLTYTFEITYYDTVAQEREVDRAVSEYLESLSLTGLSDYEKASKIYNKLITETTYATERLESKSDNLIYTAYGALVQHNCVCQGYAVALYRLFLEEGIDTRVISSIEQCHAWNISKMEDYYYLSDATWDSNMYEYNHNVYGYYFLKGYADFDEYYPDYIGSNHYNNDDQFSDFEFVENYPLAETKYVPQTKFEITTQPESYTGYENSTVNLSIETTGDHLIYQWAYSKDGRNWFKCTADGAQTNSYSFELLEAANGRRYRCVVYNAKGEYLVSEEAKIKVIPPISITKQPGSVSVAANAAGSFSIEATGDNLSFQWLYSKDGATWYKCSSDAAKAASYSFKLNKPYSGRIYKCVLTDGDGHTLKSDSATLTIQ